MCGNEAGSRRETEEQAHTFFFFFACHPLTSSSRPCSPRPYWGRGGRRWEEDSSPGNHPPKYKQLSLNQKCLSRLSPALAREGHTWHQTWDSATRGGGWRTQQPARAWGCLGGNGKARVSTSKHLGDIGENGWDQGLEGTWGRGMREGGSVLQWEAPGSGAGAEGRLLLPPERGVMRGNRAWRRREAAWAAGRGVWRSLDKEMMKRERYIYQGGGDRWEGG